MTTKREQSIESAQKSWDSFNRNCLLQLVNRLVLGERLSLKEADELNKEADEMMKEIRAERTIYVKYSKHISYTDVLNQWVKESL